jgi:hypothetical protein
MSDSRHAVVYRGAQSFWRGTGCLAHIVQIANDICVSAPTKRPLRVTSVKLVEIRVRREVAIGQAARGGIWMGSAVSVAASSAMASTCM